MQFVFPELEAFCPVSQGGLPNEKYMNHLDLSINGDPHCRPLALSLEWMDGWMDGWTDGRMDGYASTYAYTSTFQMPDGCGKCVCVCVIVCVYIYIYVLVTCNLPMSDSR